MPRSVTTGSGCGCIFGCLTAKLLPGVAVPFYISANNMSALVYLHHHWHLVFVTILSCSHSDRCVVIARCLFNVHFPKGWWCSTSFHGLMYHLSLLFGEMSLHAFSSFSDRIVCFLFLSLEIIYCKLYILETVSLWDRKFGNIFSKSSYVSSFS